MSNSEYVRWFQHLGLADVPSVGGKNASLGELYSALGSEGIRVPNGFALTAESYRHALSSAKAWQSLHGLLDDLDKDNVEMLKERAAKARAIVYEATSVDWLRQQIIAGYAELEKQYGPGVAVAVRSSATAEDLPTASFAGQHESFLNVRGGDDLFEACRRCFASIFTDRAISYRINNGFDHLKVALSVGVMKMVNSGPATSGVIFTLDTESGFRDVVFITAAYGLGENIVQGTIDPDEFYVHKPTFRQGYRALLSRELGRKQLRMIYEAGHVGATTRNVTTSAEEQERFCISDSEVLELGDYAIKIEDHYSRKADHPTPMDIEWAKDHKDGRLYVIQARPETVASRKDPAAWETYALVKTGPLLLTGRAVGEKIASGNVRVVKDQSELATFRSGEVLVASATSPDWEPVMKGAAAIVTDRGGRTCHAAIVARELGVPAVVGAAGATDRLTTGSAVTVDCTEGEIGHVYKGKLDFTLTRTSAEDIRKPSTAIMVNLGNPDLAFRSAMLPSDGVGLARMEFIINQHIGVHPMALAHLDRVSSPEVRSSIERLVRHYPRPTDYFIERLSEGIGTIVAAFYPRPAIVRLSDFKTNEYAELLGGF